MSAKGHINLFGYGNREGVYAALQRDYHRDGWTEAWWALLFWGCALGAIYVSHHADWGWIFGAIFAVQRMLRVFIDNSNRNFLMHAIDWDDATRSDTPK